jgi:hypothetical protein
MSTTYENPFEAPKWLERAKDGRYHLFLILPPLCRVFSDLKLAWNEATGRYSYDMAVIFHVLVCSEYMITSTSQIQEEVALAVISAWYEDERRRYGAQAHDVAERLTEGKVKVPPPPEQPLEWGFNEIPY